MKIITGLIGSGKTVEMIKQAHIQKFVIVTPYKSFAEELKKTAESMHLRICDPISFDEFLTLRNNQRCMGKENDSKYFIDHIELLLEKAFGNISGFICEGEDITVMKRTEKGFYKTDIFLV